MNFFLTLAVRGFFIIENGSLIKINNVIVVILILSFVAFAIKISIKFSIIILASHPLGNHELHITEIDFIWFGSLFYRFWSLRYFLVFIFLFVINILLKFFILVFQVFILGLINVLFPFFLLFTTLRLFQFIFESNNEIFQKLQIEISILVW